MNRSDYYKSFYNLNKEYILQKKKEYYILKKEREKFIIKDLIENDYVIKENIILKKIVNKTTNQQEGP